MHYDFGDCTLDTQRYELRRGGVRVPLRRKVFQVLVYLIEQRDRVVSRDEVLAQVWPDQYVGEETLTSCVKAVRRAVGDSGRAQQVIQTVHGHGLRFVAEVTVTDAPWPQAWPSASAAAGPGGPGAGTAGGARGGTGRPAPLVHHGPAGHAAGGVHHGRGRGGQNRPGGGLRGPGREPRGRCGSGTGSASTSMARAKRICPCWKRWGGSVAGRRGHTSWPGCGSRRRAGWRRCRRCSRWPSVTPSCAWPGTATQARMLRELAEALEILTAEQPLLLVLEDLHWSDAATLEWLAYVARRRDPARLLVLATYRPAEARGAAHPVDTLVRICWCGTRGPQLMVGALSAPEVAMYVARRFGEGSADGAASPRCCTSARRAMPCFWSRWWRIWCSAAWCGTARTAGNSRRPWTPPRWACQRRCGT